MAELHHPMPFIVGEQCLGSASAAISAVEKKKFYVIVVFLSCNTSKAFSCSRSKSGPHAKCLWWFPVRI